MDRGGLLEMVEERMGKNGGYYLWRDKRWKGRKEEFEKEVEEVGW